MEQLRLLLRDQRREVSLDVIMSCIKFTDALELCKSISGLEDKQIAMTLEIDTGHWSLIFNRNGNKRNFPQNKLIEFMEVCGNKIPLIWLALQCGYTLQPLKSELEIELDRERAEKEEYRKKYEYAIETLKAVNT
jgi:hypothetical protein